jgi:hypothetical protein
MNIYPLSYSIPDECVVEEIPLKKQLIAPLIPNFNNEYTFNESQENDYYNMYRESIFGITMKKCGWDCLRHYEILASGCIPLFTNIDQCPLYTMTTFPKKQLLNFVNEYNQSSDIKKHAEELLEHTKKFCTTSYSARYFLSNLPLEKEVKNILLISCHEDVNYTRELLWIGLKRYIQSRQGVAVEYPKIGYLYKNYDRNIKLHGNGFTYSRRLEDDYNFTDDEIIEKIKTHFWDIVIFGRCGPDESREGTAPFMPLWKDVIENYNKKEIVFLYGGDECADFNSDTIFKRHVQYHSQYGTCFVRELNA